MREGRFLFLGTGASSGTPMIGCDCSVCRSLNSKDRRLRPSGYLEIEGKKLLIDAGPDFRFQALHYQLTKLDGVLLTHSHFDHVAGLDELRAYYLLHHKTLPVLASTSTLEALKKRCDYLFKEKSWGISLAAQLHFQTLEKKRGETTFLGIPIRYMTYTQGGMEVNGFRFGSFAYLSDVAIYPESLFEDLEGVETLVLSALREKPSPMHLTIEQATLFAKRVGAKKTYLMHLGHECGYEAVSSTLPSDVFLSYDGLELEFKW